MGRINLLKLLQDWRPADQVSVLLRVTSASTIFYKEIIYFKLLTFLLKLECRRERRFSWQRWRGISPSRGLQPESASMPCVHVNHSSSILLKNKLASLVMEGDERAWSGWSQCSQSCGEGREQRSRICIFGELGVDEECSGGELYDVRTCNLGPCRKYHKNVNRICEFN